MLKTCLVVDDSRVVRKVSRRILEEIGFDVAEAADGVEALAWCRASMPSAILLDWNMPVMDGLEFLIQLRGEPGGDKPVVVFCTVENDPDHIARALSAGAAALALAVLLAAAPPMLASAQTPAPPIGAQVKDDKGKPVGRVEKIVPGPDGQPRQVLIRVDRVLRTLPVEALKPAGSDYVAVLSRAEIAALPPSD